jgi:lysophospholipase L1-like esterase
MSRVRRAIKIISINLLISIVLLVPIELIFGDWLSDDTAISMLNVRPNTVDVRESPLYPPGNTITFSRDKYGFRAGRIVASKIDVLVIGGSTTAERMVDDADLWTVRLQRLLAEQGCQLNIANAGIDGYSTSGHIASFEQWFNRIPGLKPRYMLVYVGINDSVLPEGIENPADPQTFKRGWRRIGHYIAAHSALRRAYVTLRAWWAARQMGLLHGEAPVTPENEWEPVELPGFGTLAAPRQAAYRGRLERLDGLIRGFGAVPVYITQMRVDGRETNGNGNGHWLQVRGGAHLGALSTAFLLAINETTLQFCRDSGEICIDLANKLHFMPGDFYDGVHNTLAGSRRIADFLAGELAPILCRSQPSR